VAAILNFGRHLGKFSKKWGNLFIYVFLMFLLDTKVLRKTFDQKKTNLP